MGKRVKLTVEQRAEAVLSLVRREESAAKVARRYGISEQTLYRYRDLFLEGGKAGLTSGKADPRSHKIEQIEKQLAQRDQVIGELTIANRVLKKLSGESP